MKKSTVFRLLTCATLIVTISQSNAHAEGNSYGLGKAAGAYIYTADLLEKISKSPCGYAVKKHYNTNNAFIEVSRYLKEADRIQLSKYLSSEQSIVDLRRNDEFITIYLTSAKQDGLDERTACGMLLSVAGLTRKKAELDWENAKDGLRNGRSSESSQSDQRLNGGRLKPAYTGPSDENIIELAKEKITHDLKDPAVAQFRSVFIRKTDFLQISQISTVCGEISGKNSYGAYVGFKKFYMQVGSKSVYGLEPSSTDPKERRKSFDSNYRFNCEGRL